MIPFTIGDRFEVHADVSPGSLAPVYIGTDHETDRPILVQIASSKAFVDDVTEWTGATQECGIGEKILDVGQLEDHRYYVISDLPNNQDVWPLRQVEKFTPAVSVSIARQLCDVVSCLHRHGYIHREITPHNILVTMNDQPVIQTLRRSGLKSLLGCSLSSELINRPLNDGTKAGKALDDHDYLKIFYNNELWDYLPAAMGELLLVQLQEVLEGWRYAILNPFVAPECAIGEGDKRTDVYSIGAILYWMIMREYPVDLRNLMVKDIGGDVLPEDVERDLHLERILEQVYMGKLEGIFEEEDTPQELSDIFRQTMSGLVDTRFQSVEELGKALDAVDWKSLQVVITNPSGHPVSDILIQIRQKKRDLLLENKFTGYTDKNGCFKIENILSGDYQIDIPGGDSYQTYKDLLTLEKSEELNIVLKPLSLWKRFTTR